MLEAIYPLLVYLNGVLLIKCSGNIYHFYRSLLIGV
jgi:hypothetical protein